MIGVRVDAGVVNPLGRPSRRTGAGNMAAQVDHAIGHGSRLHKGSDQDDGEHGREQ